MEVLTKNILEKLGYSFYLKEEERVEPDLVEISFKDIIPEFGNSEELKEFSKNRLYKHQLEAYNFLNQGYNIILKSGTGSGKTEAWVLYFLNKAKGENFKAIAMYPTLALANDQIIRLKKYCKCINKEVLQLDAPKRDEIVKKYGNFGLKRLICNSSLIITNPAFLFQEVKKLIVDKRKSLLYDYLRKLDLVVIDELDFYGPRSLALLLALMKILCLISEKRPQFVILTATLANPEELGKYLKEISKRDYKIIEGKPFRPKNYTYIILGKNLEKVYEEVREIFTIFENKKIKIEEDIKELVKDFEVFKRNAYKVISYLRAKAEEVNLNVEVPSIGVNINEILEKYLEDNGVTLVFTRSISKAEEVARKLREELPEDKRKLIATHHHLISKKEREIIEEKARKGEIKIIISPRTLTQGINIGTVIRVVHLGLPEEVREFLQREGRKGRKKEIEFTESIIIPTTKWDHELLSKGFEALEKWLNLPLEKVIINPKNKYITLFFALAKLLSNWLPKELNEEEKEILLEIGIIDEKGKIIKEKKLRWIWERLNFYEFGPPYGIKRYLLKDDKEIPLESIGHCDLVERFQIGCIDYSNDAIVVGIRKGKTSRVVTAVLEKPIKEIRFFDYDFLAEVYEEYKEAKLRWKEEPNLFKDLLKGKIFSEVLCVVYTPKNKFGELVKVPNRVIWLVSSEKPKIFTIGNKTIVTYDKKPIYVPTLCWGEYRDYTYGFTYEISEGEDLDLIRLGLAFLMIVLRRKLGIAFETIKYGFGKFGDKKYFELHEPEAAGLIEKLDWREIRKIVEEYEPDDLDLILLSLVDDLAYSEFLSKNLDWNIVKDSCLKVIDYILAKENIILEYKDKEIVIPKPSRALKILSLDLIVEEIEIGEFLPRILFSYAIFDGEEVKSKVIFFTKNPFKEIPKEIREFEKEIIDYVYDGFKIIVTNKKAIKESLEKLKLRILPREIEENSEELEELAKGKGIKKFSLDNFKFLFEKIEGKEIKLDLVSIIEKVDKWLRRMEEKEEVFLDEKLKEKIKEFIENRSKLVYYTYLFLKNRRG